MPDKEGDGEGGGRRIKDLKDQTYARLPARAPAHPLQLLPPFRHRLPLSTHLIRRAKETREGGERRTRVGRRTGTERKEGRVG